MDVGLLMFLDLHFFFALDALASDNSRSYESVCVVGVVGFATLDVRQLPLACKTFRGALSAPPVASVAVHGARGCVFCSSVAATCRGALGGPSAARRTRTGADLSRPTAVCSRQSAGPIRACRGRGAVAPRQREGYRTSAAQGEVRPDRAEAQAEALRGRSCRPGRLALGDLWSGRVPVTRDLLSGRPDFRGPYAYR